MLLIKHWAKRRRVNDAYTGTLSSYAYCLLAIAHLQQRAPPVLPVLQEGPPTKQQTIGEHMCHRCSANQQSLSRVEGNAACRGSSLVPATMIHTCRARAAHPPILVQANGAVITATTWSTTLALGLPTASRWRSCWLPSSTIGRCCTITGGELVQTMHINCTACYQQS